MFLSVYVNAQNTKYDELSKNDLKKELILRDTKIKELEIIIENKNKSNESNIIIEKIKNENAELIEIINLTNDKFFLSNFKEKYSKDINVFKNTNLEKEDDYVYHNYNLILKGIIKGTKTSSEDKQLAEKALNFNYSYLKLFAFKPKFDEAIATKFDEVKINNLIKELDSIFFDLGSNLEKKKSDFSGVLKNYSKFTCELKQELSKELFKKGRPENPLVKNEFEKLKKANSYSKYPYLVKIIEKAKSNYISYVAEEDLPCKLAKKVETPKQKEEEVNKDAPKK